MNAPDLSALKGESLSTWAEVTQQAIDSGVALNDLDMVMAARDTVREMARWGDLEPVGPVRTGQRGRPIAAGRIDGVGAA